MFSQCPDMTQHFFGCVNSHTTPYQKRFIYGYFLNGSRRKVKRVNGLLVDFFEGAVP
jgi:hypothetical protein